MKKLYVSIISAVILSGCSAKAVLVEKKVNYDPKTEARIRMYYSNGNPMVKTYSKMDCATWENTKATKAQRKMTNGLPRKTLKNVSIGMPMTERSAAALKRDNITDTDSFVEMVVDAKEKAIADAAVYNVPKGYGIRGISSVSITSHCRIAGEFTPTAGKDYEITFSYGEETCHLNIVELKPTKSPNLVEQVTVEPGNKLSYKACKYNYDDLNLLKNIFK